MSNIIGKLLIIGMIIFSIVIMGCSNSENVPVSSSEIEENSQNIKDDPIIQEEEDYIIEESVDGEENIEESPEVIVEDEIIDEISINEDEVDLGELI